jgi:hypothetical protein
MAFHCSPHTAIVTDTRAKHWEQFDLIFTHNSIFIVPKVVPVPNLLSTVMRHIGE